MGKLVDKCEKRDIYIREGVQASKRQERRAMTPLRLPHFTNKKKHTGAPNSNRNCAINSEIYYSLLTLLTLFHLSYISNLSFSHNITVNILFLW